MANLALVVVDGNFLTPPIISSGFVTVGLRELGEDCLGNSCQIPGLPQHLPFGQRAAGTQVRVKVENPAMPQPVVLRDALELVAPG